MSIDRKITLFENELEGLQFVVVHYPRIGKTNMLYEVTFPRLREEADKLKNRLAKIHMFNRISDGLNQIEFLAKQEKYGEAQDYVLELTKELMEASGTAKALRKRYVMGDF